MHVTYQFVDFTLALHGEIQERSSIKVKEDEINHSSAKKHLGFGKDIVLSMYSDRGGNAAILDLSRRRDNHLIHVYSPQNAAEEAQILSEIEVFIMEYGLPSCHHNLQPRSTCELTHNLQEVAENICHSTQVKTLTIITWGHGNAIDNKHGFYKVFPDKGDNFELFILDDLLDYIKDLSEKLNISTQVLLTQCWAHCHDQRRFGELPRFQVAWLTCDEMPETSARRWDSLKSGEEMSPTEFEEFISEQGNYDNLHSITEKKYNSIERRIFLKYLHYSSIHIEAMCYLVNQRGAAGL